MPAGSPCGRSTGLALSASPTQHASPPASAALPYRSLQPAPEIAPPDCSLQPAPEIAPPDCSLQPAPVAAPSDCSLPTAPAASPSIRPLGCAPAGLEIAEQGNAPLPVRFVQIAQNLLDHEHRPAVPVRRAERGRFRDRRLLRLAVDGGRRAENEPPHAEPLHDVAQDDRSRDRKMAALLRRRRRMDPREMDDRLDPVLFENPLKTAPVKRVKRMKGKTSADRRLYPFERRRMLRAIDDDDLAARFQQLRARMAANIPCSARNEHRHSQPSVGWSRAFFIKNIRFTKKERVSSFLQL
jgi:hypothetical protein